MSAQHLNLTCPSPEATCRVGRHLARSLVPGDSVMLSGPVGAGKTHFARCTILSMLDRPEDVPSPSYTLVQTYPGRAGEIWHADLYRLSGAAELEELGLEEAFRDAITFVEWPDRLDGLAPSDALWISFDASGADETRVLTFSWTAPKWPAKLKGIGDA